MGRIWWCEFSGHIEPPACADVLYLEYLQAEGDFEMLVFVSVSPLWLSLDMSASKHSHPFSSNPWQTLLTCVAAKMGVVDNDRHSCYSPMAQSGRVSPGLQARYMAPKDT